MGASSAVCRNLTSDLLLLKREKEKTKISKGVVYENNP